jgi:hypothetical protein
MKKSKKLENLKNNLFETELSGSILTGGMKCCPGLCLRWTGFPHYANECVKDEIIVKVIIKK